jgi:hypothetical protein
MLIIVDFDDLF